MTALSQRVLVINYIIYNSQSPNLLQAECSQMLNALTAVPVYTYLDTYGLLYYSDIKVSQKMAKSGAPGVLRCRYYLVLG